MFNASAYENVEDNELHDFLKFLYTKSSSSDFTDEIERLVNESKGNEKWRVEYMNVQLWLDDAKEAAREEGLKEGRAVGLEKGRAEGREEGREEELKQIIKNMLAQNLSVEMIAKCTGVPEEKVMTMTGERA